MYSVKPGRGPSLMGGIMGIAVAIFGVYWTITALSMGAPVFFALFGLVFAVVAVCGALFNFFNATQRNRMSTLDVTTGEEEPDPLAQAMGFGTEARGPAADAATVRRFEGDYCPYCGGPVQKDFDYCPKCGKNV